MQEVTCQNGVVLTWDDTISVGTLITAYHAGYHVVTGIEFRDHSPPIFTYNRVVSKDGVRVNSKRQESCDASYCRKITQETIKKIFREEVNAAIVKRENLSEFVA